MTIEEYMGNQEVRDNDLRSLMADNRFNAVKALMKSLREESVNWVSSPTLASESGKQNHALGQISAFVLLDEHLRSIWDNVEDEGI